MSAGIRRTPISALSHGSSDFLIVAVIIAKQTPRTIKSKSVDMRSVWNFTLRDAPADYINVSFWGSSIFIDNIAQNFHIGDVVDIIKAKATFRKNDNTSFVPDVTSPFMLTMNENFSEMCLHSEDDCAEFHHLLRLPTRPPGDYITLSDVHANGQALKGKHVNLLVAVRSVGALRQVTTKQEGKVLECREVEMMDQSPTCLYIQLWDAEMAFRADNWKPRETVLFIADVRLNWNNFKKCMTATVTARTIITENPDMADADDLREHARNAPIVPSAILDQFAISFPEPSTINNVMSCQTVWNRATNAESAESFTALVYAAIIEMDLDGLLTLTVSKCQHCQQSVDEAIGLCMNSDCLVNSGAERPLSQRVYDLRVTLADHTGSLPGCRLTSPAASQALNCSPDEFDCLSLDAKTMLKWQLLLRRCAARLIVLPATGDQITPLISVLAIEKVSLPEYASRTPMF
uniref:MEIOB-like N-terminal domain-containing protein n=1 Tax=Cuerna arida TaxID=1464854 RepID=A0A1B6GAB0_9HEMI